MIKLQLPGLLLGVILLTSGSSSALTLSAFDQGRFISGSSSGGVGAGQGVAHDPNSQSLQFQIPFGGFATVDENGYVIFDLSSLPGTTTSASIEFDTSAVSCVLCSPGQPFSVSLFSVASDPALFQNAYNEHSNPLFFLPPLGPGFAIYQDLVSGSSYAGLSIGVTGTQSQALNAAAISAINAASGGLFAVGIDVAGPLGGITFGTARLVLTQVPEPSLAAFLMVGGLLGLPKRRPSAWPVLLRSGRRSAVPMPTASDRP